MKDFYATARMTTRDIENHLSRIHAVTNVNPNSTNQDFQSFLQNLNNPSPNSPDENLQRVSREFNILNTNFFQCLESYRYFTKIKGNYNFQIEIIAFLYLQ